MEIYLLVQMSEGIQKKQFSKKQLRAGHGFIHQMAATNQYASQKGMSPFGSVRHGRDIKADDADQRGQGVLTKVAATHLYASQKGMAPFGSVRHGKDIVADDADQRSHGTLSKVSQTNIFASQRGMTAFGAVRHCGDIRVKQLYEEGDDDEYPTDEDEPKPVQRRRESKVNGTKVAPEAAPKQKDPTPEPEPQPEPEPEPEPVVEAADEDDSGGFSW